MALKEQLVKWKAAMDSFDSSNYELSISQFQSFAETSKLWFNVGQLGMKLKDSYAALDALDKAIELDPWLAIAYLQRGVIMYYGQDIESALENFQDCLEKMRMNPFIKYNQLGIEYTLHESYVIFNIALCFLMLGENERAAKYFDDARVSGQSGDDVDTTKIDQAIRLGNDAVQVFPYEVSDSLIFRPQAELLKCSKKVDYLGKSKIVSGATATDRFNGFSGRQVKEVTFGRDYRQKMKAEQPTSSPLPVVPENCQRRPTLERKVPTLARINTSPSISRKISSAGATGSAVRSATIPRRCSSIKTGPARITIELPKLEDMGLGRNSFLHTPSQTPDASTAGKTLSEYLGTDQSSVKSESPLVDKESRCDSRYESRYVKEKYQDDSPRYQSPVSDHKSDDSPSNYSVCSVPGNKIKIKIHFNDTRMIFVPADVYYDEMKTLVRQKLRNEKVEVKFVDEDGEKIVMTNDDDLDEAIECSKDPRKLELWAFVPV
jgi:hypothetical protein